MKKQINFELDSDLKYIIDHLSEKGGISTTQWLTQAIMNYIPFYERGLKKQEEIKNKYLTSDEWAEGYYCKEK